MNEYLKSEGRQEVNNISITQYLKSTFGETSYIRLKVGSKMVAFYGKLKEKEEDDVSRST